MKVLSVVKVLILILLAPSALWAADYRCADTIISVGDSSYDLITKCGEPDWKQTHGEEIIERGSKVKTYITVEEWTYDLGPQRFTRIFKLRDGKVVDVQSGGYGTVKESSGRRQCSDQIISTGDSAADVMAKCGQPAWKDKREEVIRERLDDNTVRKVSVIVEDWTYNFGPSQFVRIFTFRNGKVTEIRTGGYGN